MSKTAKPIISEEKPQFKNKFKPIVFYEIKEIEFLKPYYESSIYNSSTYTTSPFYVEQQYGSPIVFPDYESAQKVKGKYIYVFRTSIAGYIKLYSEMYADESTGKLKFFDVTDGRKETSIETDYISVYENETQFERNFTVHNYYYISSIRFSDAHIRNIRMQLNNQSYHYTLASPQSIFDNSMPFNSHYNYLRPNNLSVIDDINFYHFSQPDFLSNYPLLGFNSAEGIKKEGDSEVIYVIDYLEIAQSLKEEYIEKRDAYCKWVDEDQTKKDLRTLSDIVENLCTVQQNARNIKGLSSDMVNNSLPENWSLNQEFYKRQNCPIKYFKLEDIKKQKYAYSCHKHKILSDSEMSSYDPSREQDFFHWRKDYINYEIQLLFEYEVIAEQIAWILTNPGIHNAINPYKLGSFEGPDTCKKYTDKELMDKKYLSEPFGKEDGKDIYEFIIGKLLERLGESKIGQRLLQFSVGQFKDFIKNLGIKYGDSDPEYSFDDIELFLKDKSNNNIIQDAFCLSFICVRKGTSGFAALLEAAIPYLYEFSIDAYQYTDIGHIKAISWMLNRRCNFTIIRATNAGETIIDIKTSRPAAGLSLFVVIDKDSTNFRLSAVGEDALTSCKQLIEVINLGIAVWQLTECKTNYDRVKVYINIVGATADFILATQEFFTSRTGLTIIQKTGVAGKAIKTVVTKLGPKAIAVLGVISGVADAICDGMEAYSNFSQGDRETAIAYSVAAVGGIVTAVGSVVALAFPPAGAVVILIGIILQVIGTLWAFFADKTDMELWLTYCCWGESFHGDKYLGFIPAGENTSQPSWALKPFSEWNDIPAEIDNTDIFGLESKNSKYNWIGDIVTQLNSFKKLLYDIDFCAFYYNDDYPTGFFRSKKISVVILKTVIPDNLRGPKLTVTFKIDRGSEKLNFFQLQEICEYGNTIAINHNEKILLFNVWIDSKYYSDKEFLKEYFSMIKAFTTDDQLKLLCDSFEKIYENSDWRYNLYKKIDKITSWGKIHTIIETKLTSDDLLGEEYEEKLDDNIGLSTAILLI